MSVSTKELMSTLISMESKHKQEAEHSPNKRKSPSRKQPDPLASQAQVVARKTKERLVINLFKQVIMFGNDLLKQDVRTQLLRTHAKIDRELKVKSKGINYLLALYGEDIPQMLQYFVEEEKKERDEQQAVMPV